MSILDFLGPWKYVAYAAIAASLIGGATYGVHHYNDSLREEGRQEVRAADKAAIEAQAETNRELQRAAELKYVVRGETRDRYFVTTVKEIHEAAAPLAACQLPRELVRLLNDARTCASSDSPSSCGAAGKVPSP